MIMSQPGHPPITCVQTGYALLYLQGGWTSSAKPACITFTHNMILHS